MDFISKPFFYGILAGAVAAVLISLLVRNLVARALIERARAGVAVNVLLDWVGSVRVDLALLERPPEAGGRPLGRY